MDGLESAKLFIVGKGTEQEKTFTDKKKAVEYFASLKIGSLLDDFVKETWKANLKKEEYKEIISSNLQRIADLRETGRPKRHRRNIDQLIADGEYDPVTRKKIVKDEVTDEGSTPAPAKKKKGGKKNS
jgi:dsDNA-binding SOS-regulon protein